ncbi:MAG: aminoglycoside phosphotransferase family protein [Promethearchaeia archaeon]
MQNKIRKIIKGHCHKEIAQINRIETGLFNKTYIITLKEKLFKLNGKEVNSPKELILRISPRDDAGFLFYERNMMKQEPKIHKLVLDLTNIPIPEIYVFDKSRKIIDRNYLIMERLNGTALSRAYWLNSNERNKIVRKIGEYLRSIHNIHAKRFGYLGPHRPMKPQSSWWEAFKIMWSKMIQGIYEYGFYSESEKLRYIGLLEEKRRAFRTRKKISSCLLHMDIWAQNILVNKNGIITGIVDWDRAVWGDPEIEYAVLDYCGISKPSFWEGYGLQRRKDHATEVRDLFYLLYEHQKYIPINFLRGNDEKKAQRYTRECKQLFRKLERKK